MADKNGKHALADTNTYMRISIYPYKYPYAHTYVFAHKHTHITTRVHIYIFAPECVCCIKYFTLKQRKYAINSSIKSLVIHDQHYAYRIVKIWQNTKTYKTDMHICTWDGRYATATELLLLVVPGAVVLAAPSAVSNICRSVDTDYLAQISRLWQAVYMNLPNAFSTRGSSLVRRNLNASLFYFTNVFIFCWQFGKRYYVPGHISYRWVESDVHL